MRTPRAWRRSSAPAVRSVLERSARPASGGAQSPLDRILAVLRRVADVVLLGAGDRGKARLERLFYLPFLDSRRPVLLERDFQAQRARRDRLERDLVVPVLRDAVRFHARDRFPLVAVAVEDAPGARHADLAPAGVVEPIDLGFRHDRRSR